MPDSFLFSCHLGQTVSDNLKWLNVKIIANPCELAKDNKIQMCATTLAAKNGLCDGDSGGPVVSFENGIPELVAVISMKVGTCGKFGTDVTTRVTPFKQWINDIINKLCKRGK